VTAGRVEAAAAAAALNAGQAASDEYHAAAAAMPGVGALVALPVPASGAATGDAFNVPPGVPALRPVPVVPDIPVYADQTVGGVTYVSAGGVLDGSTAVPFMRSSDAVVYVPASNPRPSLPDRLRTAWRALTGRT
jgi:hypothetical protein